MDVTTRVYDPALDLFAPCRRPDVVSGRGDTNSLVK
jgi:hypothetical protein